MKLVDDHINDKSYQSVLLSALLGTAPPRETEDKSAKQKSTQIRNSLLTKEDFEAFGVLAGHQTAKKAADKRQEELVKIVQKPLEVFFEEKLQYYLMEINANPTLKSLFTAIALNGSSKDSDLIDEMLRQVQKSSAYEKSQPGVKQPLFGHADLHRVLKDMVKVESLSTHEDAKALPFSS